MLWNPWSLVQLQRAKLNVCLECFLAELIEMRFRHRTAAGACGGPQREGGAACEAPYAGAEVRLVSASGATMATARTTTSGHYLFSAPPGRYRVMVTTPIRLTRCPSPEVVVTEGKVSVVDVECDSGMR